MKKVTFISFILIVFVLVGCTQSYAKRNLALEEAIYSIAEENNEFIPIKSLTDFNWDKAFLFGPYTSPESISEKLGVNYKDESNIYVRDDIFLLAFLNDNKVVCYVEINRQKRNFSIGDYEYLTPTNDLLNISSQF